jgi:hypothetical protein
MPRELGREAASLGLRFANFWRHATARRNRGGIDGRWLRAVTK